MEVRKAEFARQAGVTRSAITQNINNKSLIANAAGFLDTENPVNAAFLTRQRQKVAEAAAAEHIKNGGAKSFTGETFFVNSPPNETIKSANDLALMAASGLSAREFLNMTLREIVTKFPGIDKIERYAKILKDVTMAAEKEQRIQERALTTIPKDFVISRLFTFIEGVIKQIIVDHPEAVVDRVIALAISESKTSRIEIIDTIRNSASQIVSRSKENVITELNNLKSKYQKDIQANDSQLDSLKQVLEEAAVNG